MADVNFFPPSFYEKVERSKVIDGAVMLSPDRWALLVKHFDEIGPGKFGDLGIKTIMPIRLTPTATHASILPSK